jgi:hypothetical protein
MSQLDVFKHQPIARNTDPGTSHAAEEVHTLGKRAERARQVLDLIGRYPGHTTGELSRLMYSEYPELPFRTSAETPHKRAADLLQKGMVRQGPKRKCRDSGYEALTWYITDAGIRELG